MSIALGPAAAATLRVLGCQLALVAACAVPRPLPAPAPPAAERAAGPAATRLADIPLADHHMHLFSPAVRRWLEKELSLPPLPPFTTEELIPILDADHVQSAAILSNAYFFSRPGATADDAHTLRAENDWVAGEVARHPDRLVGFFSVNPLADSALAEIERCAASRRFVGLKLHLANSDVDLRDPSHVKRLTAVFERANALDLVIAIHMRTKRADYGREDARIFIDQVLSRAPDVPVQVAHLGGWGGYDPATDAALGAFADRLASKSLAREHLYFDISAAIRKVSGKGALAPGAAAAVWWPQRRYHRLVGRLRRIGFDRVLFSTDWPDWTPRSYLADLARDLPLDEEELRTVLANRAPWLR